MKAFDGLVAGYWISTSLVALQMSFTAYDPLRARLQRRSP
jgi:hypothetical protein